MFVISYFISSFLSPVEGSKRFLEYDRTLLEYVCFRSHIASNTAIEGILNIQ
jgi:hypothetical protein